MFGFCIQKGHSNGTGDERGFQRSKPMSVVKVNVILEIQEKGKKITIPSLFKIYHSAKIRLIYCK